MQKIIYNDTPQTIMLAERNKRIAVYEKAVEAYNKRQSLQNNKNVRSAWASMREYVKKNPLDATKASKSGRLKLVKTDAGYVTRRLQDAGEDELKQVFYNGEIMVSPSFAEIRKRAQE